MTEKEKEILLTGIDKIFNKYVNRIKACDRLIKYISKLMIIENKKPYFNNYIDLEFKKNNLSKTRFMLEEFVKHIQYFEMAIESIDELLLMKNNKKCNKCGSENISTYKNLNDYFCNDCEYFYSD